jgi:PIN domain nuclease of toxin-antitoxin system
VTRLLLDTHVLLWWLDDSPQISRDTRALIADRANSVFYSAACRWEISIKQATGKLRVSDSLDLSLAAEPFHALAITHRHAQEVSRLPLIHHDPFDRILIAQSIVEDFTVVSCDRVFAGYGIATIAP